MKDIQIKTKVLGKTAYFTFKKDDEHFKTGKKSFNLGTYHPDYNHIYINTNSGGEVMRHTVIHEIAHFIIYNFVANIQKYDEEVLCNFCGSYVDTLDDVANEVITKYIKEQKRLKNNENTK